jgi:deferrochelatase/peroxidase EfeB
MGRPTEHPFGTPDVHVALALYAKDDESLQKVLELARMAHHDLWQISVVYRMQFGELPEGRNPFGFKDGLHNPHVEGSGPAPHAGAEPSIKAGEFILGYPDESGDLAQVPIPRELRHNGTFVAFRKFHMDVAAISPLPARPGLVPGGGGPPGCQDGGPVAQRCAPRTGAGSRQSGARERPQQQQRLLLCR